MFNISKDRIIKICKILSAKLDKKRTPHTFRHSFAVMFLKNGGDISVLKELLGHKNLQSTLNLEPQSNSHLVIAIGCRSLLTT